MKLSLALIVSPTKEEAKKLDKALSSVKGVFDEICITQAGSHPSEEVEKVIEKHKAKQSFFRWVGDFSKARNFNFKQCTGDWIMWLDADDIVRGADKIRENIQMADDNNVTGLSTVYNYSHDKFGQVEDSHWKLQMVKNGNYEWKGIIHEDLLPVKDGKNANIKDVIRVHTANKEDSHKSLVRNIEILEKAMVDEAHEPRHYFYAARCYLGLDKWQEVIDVITKYLQLSNWKQERYDALNMAGEAWMRLGNNDKAIETHQLAILELEDAPDAYIFKARNYLQKEEWMNAITNLTIAETRDSDNVVLKRSALYDHDLYVMSAMALLNLGMYEDAVANAGRAYNNRKTEESKEIYNLALKMYNDENMTKMYRKIGEALVGDEEKVSALLSTVPEEIKDDPRLLALAFSEGVEWAEDTVTWFCGPSVGVWDGETAKTKGVGGSETAVIELSKQWAEAGKKVTVFNRCDAPAGGLIIDGVTYRNYWEFNKEDTFNTLILWRGPQLIDHGLKAKQIIIDMHDVSSDGIFTNERLEAINYVFVKSEYHKELYPSVPDEKFIVVGNGINLDRFEEEGVKNKNRFIYTSCPSRGLENILDSWDDIKKAVPKAELHVFYGWSTYKDSHKNDPAKLAWAEEMEGKMSKPGIKNHGRVDQNTLAEEMKKSYIWLYPTEFPEIHCITALEMQAAKVLPITTGYAALEETQQSGIKIEGDPKKAGWKESMIEEIKFARSNQEVVDAEMKEVQTFIKKNTWDNVAKVWLKTV